MNCPCNGCDERKLGCHSNCTKSPSYEDWKQWCDEKSKIYKSVSKDRAAYLHSVEYSADIKRRKL